ncbi:MAG: hypothetical protein FWH24_05720, partial [Oscillospiraceae bacterium]|nr:hypothetical protein [Oscillospiraceae bacterium]
EIYEFENIIEILQNKYKKDFELGIITESPEKLKLISQYFKAVIGKDNFPRFICNLPFYTSVIDYDLSLRPCFFLPSCGSVKNGNLIQCINNDEAKKIRKQILKNERKECAYCIVARFRDMNTGKLNYINDDRNVIGI